MWSFLAELARPTEGPRTIIVMDDEYREQPRQFQVEPRRLLWLFGGAALAMALVGLLLLVFTPLRELIPGYGTSALRRDAHDAVLRLAALEDSLAVQQQYVDDLRQLLTGPVGADPAGRGAPAGAVPAVEERPQQAPAGPPSENWADHEQPALPVARLPVGGEMPARTVAAGERYLTSLQLPALPPVGGLLTRSFDARTGHYAVDLAVEVGTIVRAIGDGYVIFADWTHEGGYAVAVQHADGYVSIYKHNQRLLKRVGDRVRAREALAVSGNSGEFTTGPHLHFELWDNGLAQDPSQYLVGL